MHMATKQTALYVVTFVSIFGFIVGIIYLCFQYNDENSKIIKPSMINYSYSNVGIGIQNATKKTKETKETQITKTNAANQLQIEQLWEQPSKTHRICAFVLCTSQSRHHFVETYNVANTWGFEDKNVYFVFEKIDMNNTLLTTSNLCKNNHCIFLENCQPWVKYRAKKTLLLFKYIALNIKKFDNKCDWYLKADTDSFILLNELYFNTLQCIDHTEAIYCGDVRGRPKLLQTWKSERYGFAACKGYIVSSGLINLFAKNVTLINQCINKLPYSQEDATFGFCIRWSLNIIVYNFKFWTHKTFDQYSLFEDENHLPPKYIEYVLNDTSVIKNNIDDIKNIIGVDEYDMLYKQASQFFKGNYLSKYFLCLYIHHVNKFLDSKQGANKYLMYEMYQQYKLLKYYDNLLRYKILNLTFRNFCVTKEWINRHYEFENQTQGQILKRIYKQSCKNEWLQYKQFILE